MRFIVGLIMLVISTGHSYLAIADMKRLRRLNPMYSGPLKHIKASQFGYIAASCLFVSISFAILAPSFNSRSFVFLTAALALISLMLTGCAIAYDYHQHKKLGR